jgi:hypothetical protein
MKIVGFTQHRNELSKGNLHNWLRCMDMCEKIYIYDQGSDDGSLEILRAHPKCVLIESPTNDFVNENRCKKILLEKLLSEQPDTDWILWMDCDYLLSNNVLKDNFSGFFKLIEDAESGGHGAVAFGHYNLWRSDTYYRVDDNYHISHANGRISLWKNNGNLRFAPTAGLHQSPQPLGLGSNVRVNCDLIHRGFATDYQITTKYNIYKSFGQSGWDLERLLSERTLSVERLPDGTLPYWFELTDDINPKTKKPMIQSYKQLMGFK